MSTYRQDFDRLSKMSDDAVLGIWFAITDCIGDEKPDDDWCELVYGELSIRGLSALKRDWDKYPERPSKYEVFEW